MYNIKYSKQCEEFEKHLLRTPVDYSKNPPKIIKCVQGENGEWGPPLDEGGLENEIQRDNNQ